MLKHLATTRDKQCFIPYFRINTAFGRCFATGAHLLLSLLRLATILKRKKQGWELSRKRRQLPRLRKYSARKGRRKEKYIQLKQHDLAHYSLSKNTLVKASASSRGENKNLHAFNNGPQCLQRPIPNVSSTCSGRGGAKRCQAFFFLETFSNSLSLPLGQWLIQKPRVSQPLISRLFASRLRQTSATQTS